MRKYTNKILLNFIAVLAVFTYSFSVFATDITVLPAKPEGSYFVTDLAGVLNQLTIDDVTSKNTEKLGPASEIVVLTVNSIGNNYTLEQFVDEVFSTWQIGGENEEGILFVMEIGGGNYRAKVGPGISENFSEESLSNILSSQIEPYFAAADYNAAATSFVNSVIDLIENDDGLPEEVSKADTTTSEGESSATGEEEGTSIGSVIWGIVQVILVIVLILVALVAGLIVYANIKAQKQKARRKAQRNARRQGGTKRPSGEGGQAQRSGQNPPRKRRPPTDHK